MQKYEDQIKSLDIECIYLTISIYIYHYLFKRGIEGEVFKQGIFAKPFEFDGAGFAASLFGDDDFGDAFIGGFLVVVIISIDEGDHVGVLFDGAGFAEVLEHGALVGSGFDATVELGEGDDGDGEFFGEGLEGARYFGNFLFARGGVGGSRHELEVVDDDEPDVFFGLESSCFGGEACDGNGGGFVDEDFGGGEAFHGLEEAVPFGVLDASGAQVVGVNFGARGNDAAAEFLLGHFERKEGGGDMVVDGGVGEHVEGQRGFAHGGTCGDDGEGAGPEAGGFAVKIDESRGDARDMVVIFVEFFDEGEGGFHGLGEAEIGLCGVLQGEGERLLVELIEELRDVIHRELRGDARFVGDFDGFSQQRGFSDVGGVLTDVDGGGDVLGEVGQVLDPSGFLEEFEVVEIGVERAEIDGFSGLVQDAHGAKNFSVEGRVEVLGSDEIRGGVERGIVEDDASQHGDFGLRILWDFELCLGGVLRFLGFGRPWRHISDPF